MFEDKRDYRRCNALLTPVSCEKSECQTISIMIKDVSGSGMGILTSEKLCCGDQVNLELRIPKDDIPLFVIGEVAWTVKHKKMENVYSTGVKWVNLNCIDKNRLINHLNNSFS
ncbi:MAG: PilZ domain-containing protein [Candidatus Omnitrophota bacterium]